MDTPDRLIEVINLESKTEKEEEKSTTNKIGNEKKKEDEMMEGFIRIRSQSDGIFEQEEEEEDDDDEKYFHYIMDQMKSAEAVRSSRKRKQEIDFLKDASVSVTEKGETEWPEEKLVSIKRDLDVDMEPMMEQTFQSRKRPTIPLYLLNPDDYANDPMKLRQIRRAIVTYRHHQEKKIQIMKLAQENAKLREHVEALRKKILELSACGCEKNKTADLELFDIVIPPVPHRNFTRKGSLPPITSPSSPKPKPATPQLYKKPLINISPSRLADFNCNGFTPNYNVSAPFAYHAQPQQVSVSKNGKTVSNLTGSLVTGNDVPRQCPSILNMNNSASGSNHAFNSTSILAQIKTKDLSPATPTPPSRIVFAKRGSSRNAVKTASQLLFGARSFSTGTGIKPAFEPEPNLTASQLVFANRSQTKSATIANPLSPMMNNWNITNQLTPFQFAQASRTAPNQIVKLNVRKNSNSARFGSDQQVFDLHCEN